jgi:hypothetical protein
MLGVHTSSIRKMLAKSSPVTVDKASYMSFCTESTTATDGSFIPNTMRSSTPALTNGAIKGLMVPALRDICCINANGVP